MSAHEDVADLLHWCQEAAQFSNLHPIELDYWGCYATNARLQTHWYGWFPTRPDMLEFFRCCWPIHYHATPEETQRDGAVLLRIARFSEYVRQFEAGAMDMAAFCSCLGSAHPDVSVHWIGTLDELANGDTAFAREWRSEFRMTGGSGDFAPLRDEEWDDALLFMGCD